MNIRSFGRELVVQFAVMPISVVIGCSFGILVSRVPQVDNIGQKEFLFVGVALSVLLVLFVAAVQLLRDNGQAIIVDQCLQDTRAMRESDGAIGPEDSKEIEQIARKVSREVVYEVLETWGQQTRNDS